MYYVGLSTRQMPVTAVDGRQRQAVYVCDLVAFNWSLWSVVVNVVSDQCGSGQCGHWWSVWEFSLVVIAQCGHW